MIAQITANVMLAFLLTVSFAVAPTQAATTVVAWGDDAFGQCHVPVGLTNVVAIAAGNVHSLAVRVDGTVAAWGGDEYGQVDVPVGLNNVVAIASGYSHSLAVRGDGTVVGWGLNDHGQATPPPLTDAVGVAAGAVHSLILRSNGTVVAWGYDDWGQISVPANVTNAVAVAAGDLHSLALCADGSVVAWGYNAAGQCNVPDHLTNAVAIAAGLGYSLALRADGTVVAWGDNSRGQTEVPGGLTNVLAIAGEGGYGPGFRSFAAKDDGTIISWGSAADVPAGLSHVLAIAASGDHTLALVRDDAAPFIRTPPADQRADPGTTILFRVVAWGARPLHYQWSKDGVDLAMQTDSILALANVQLADSGNYTVMVTNAFGSVTSRVARLAVEMPVLAVHDGSRDFSIAANPNGVWSYGWMETLSGACTRLGAPRTYYADNGVPIASWEWSLYQGPIVNRVVGPGTAVSAGGAFIGPPGTIYFAPGPEGTTRNFGVIRLTVPAGGTGDYRLATAVQPLFDGALSADSDFHVVHNRRELFGRSLAPNEGTAYTNTVRLAGGDTVDFAVGRGADGLSVRTGLKIQATLSLLSNPPPVPPVIVAQPQNQTVVAGTNVVLSVRVTGSPPFTYQWSFQGTNLEGATMATLLLTNVQPEDAGDYTVAITDAAGYAMSEPATLTVLVAPSITTQPTGQTAYWGKSATFQVRANGTLPLTYLWYVDGFPIEWATNVSLALTNLDLAAGGDYWVEICNRVSCVTSAPARLVVNPAGIALGLYPGLTINGTLGKRFGIQYTTDVSQTNSWLTLTNFTLSQPVQLWVDTDADTTSGLHPKRFYRVVPVP